MADVTEEVVVEAPVLDEAPVDAPPAEDVALEHDLAPVDPYKGDAPIDAEQVAEEVSLAPVIAALNDPNAAGWTVQQLEA